MPEQLEQLVTFGRPFVVTNGGNVVTMLLVSLDESLKRNAERLGISLEMLCRLIEAEKAWERERGETP